MNFNVKTLLTFLVIAILLYFLYRMRAYGGKFFHKPNKYINNFDFIVENQNYTEVNDIRDQYATHIEKLNDAYHKGESETENQLYNDLQQSLKKRVDEHLNLLKDIENINVSKKTRYTFIYQLFSIYNGLLNTISYNDGQKIIENIRNDNQRRISGEKRKFNSGGTNDDDLQDYEDEVQKLPDIPVVPVVPVVQKYSGYDYFEQPLYTNISDIIIKRYSETYDLSIFDNKNNVKFIMDLMTNENDISKLVRERIFDQIANWWGISKIQFEDQPNYQMDGSPINERGICGLRVAAPGLYGQDCLNTDENRLHIQNLRRLSKHTNNEDAGVDISAYNNTEFLANNIILELTAKDNRIYIKTLVPSLPLPRAPYRIALLMPGHVEPLNVDATTRRKEPENPFAPVKQNIEESKESEESKKIFKQANESLNSDIQALIVRPTHNRNDRIYYEKLAEKAVEHIKKLYLMVSEISTGNIYMSEIRNLETNYITRLYQMTKWQNVFETNPPMYDHYQKSLNKKLGDLYNELFYKMINSNDSIIYNDDYYKTLKKIYDIN